MQIVSVVRPAVVAVRGKSRGNVCIAIKLRLRPWTIHLDNLLPRRYIDILERYHNEYIKTDSIDFIDLVEG